ncbi:MAG: hypothetical protein PHD97_04355 [Bacteroidales bacterium]|nr:hypothetical protein [Bacteroidales bacterium]
MRNILNIGIISIVCLFFLESCSNEKLFTQKKYQELKKVPINSIEAKYQGYVNQKENDVETMKPNDENTLASANDGDIELPFIIRKSDMNSQLENTREVLSKIIGNKKINQLLQNDKKINFLKIMPLSKKLKKSSLRRGHEHSFMHLILVILIVILICALLNYLVPGVGDKILYILILALLLALILYLLGAY